MEELIRITEEEHGVLLEIAYATDNNFTGAPVYRRGECYLHPEAERCLREAVRLAEALGYRLKVFDAFRPTEAQWKLWEHTPDPEFLADPRRGSPHSRGVAVDLTLCDRQGRELSMGTGFDEFSPRSHHGVTEVPQEAQRHRYVLLGIMTAAGWDFYRNEWWHYQLFGSRKYALLSDAEARTGMM